MKNNLQSDVVSSFHVSQCGQYYLILQHLTVDSPLIADVAYIHLKAQTNISHWSSSICLVTMATYRRSRSDVPDLLSICV